MFGWLTSLIGDIAGGLYDELPPEITGLFDPSTLPELASPDITFQPFTVTSGVGGVTAGPQGTQYNLSPQQQAIADQLSTQAQSFYGQAAMPTAEREAAVYDRMRALQRPAEQQQRLATEERLAQQGRLGLSTAMYGGAPELLAQEQAVSQARNQAMLQAMGQAQREQAQQASLGGQFLQQSYAPQAALLSAFSPALNVASMADVARRQQGEFDLESQIANINAALQQRSGLANLYSGLFSSGIGVAGGIGGGLLDILGF